MRRAILALILAAAGFPAAAQTCRGPEGLPEPQVAPPLAEGEFRRVPGKGLACVMPEEQGAAMYRTEAKITYLPCLRIGSVGISDDVSDAEDFLGPPFKVSAIGAATEARAYFVNQQAEPKPYYVVTYRRGNVVGVQLVGPPPQLPVAFSGIRLGDRMERVIDVLGRPTSRCDGPHGVESWFWQPFPVGIDMADGVVRAMKVSWPRK